MLGGTMKDPEFAKWRRGNLATGVVGVIAAVAGTALHFMGNPYGFTIMVAGVIWYIIFYLRYVVVRRSHEADQFNLLLDKNNNLRVTNEDLRHGHTKMKTKLAEQMRCRLGRDIKIATLLTRRFAFAMLNRYARDYRHSLLDPVIEMIETEIITEEDILAHLDEPAAIADVLHNHLGKNPDLRRLTPRLISACDGHWPDPANTAA